MTPGETLTHAIGAGGLGANGGVEAVRGTSVPGAQGGSGGDTYIRRAGPVDLARFFGAGGGSGGLPSLSGAAPYSGWVDYAIGGVPHRQNVMFIAMTLPGHGGCGWVYEVGVVQPSTRALGLGGGSAFAAGGSQGVIGGSASSGPATASGGGAGGGGGACNVSGTAPGSGGSGAGAHTGTIDGFPGFAGTPGTLGSGGGGGGGGAGSLASDAARRAGAGGPGGQGGGGWVEYVWAEDD